MTELEELKAACVAADDAWEIRAAAYAAYANAALVARDAARAAYNAADTHNDAVDAAWKAVDANNTFKKAVSAYNAELKKNKGPIQ